MKTVTGPAALIAGDGALPEETARQMAGAGLDVTAIPSGRSGRPVPSFRRTGCFLSSPSPGAKGS
jgi:hypothetical protein